MSSPEDNKYAQYDPEKVDLSVVAMKSLFLGIMLSVNITMIILAYTHQVDIPNWITRVNGYVLFICIFHILEFFSTALFNNSQVDDDSFILGDTDLHIVNAISLLEFGIRQILYPISYPRLGLFILVLGQITRTLAMYTARESFNHYIQREYKKTHVLISNGIYSFMRHPSYAGFFWWFIGLQLYLGNIVTLIGGTWRLWGFFNKRIEFEEKYLVSFFKDDYQKYKSSTWSGIPLIP